MTSLRTLGSLDLRGPDGAAVHSVLAQPKRSALLAYLAVARPRGFHRRDTLVGLFWPESDQEHARAALSTALSFLRRSLGDGVLLTRGTEEVGLDPEQIKADAFPRLAGVAELAGSAESDIDWDEYRLRLGAQSARWTALGLNSRRSPLVPWNVGPPDT